MVEFKEKRGLETNNLEGSVGGVLKNRNLDGVPKELGSFWALRDSCWLYGIT
jgi:hypothetical protein